MPKARYSPAGTKCEHDHTLVRRMITKVAKAWDRQLERVMAGRSRF
jgi:hypothetical protein